MFEDIGQYVVGELTDNYKIDILCVKLCDFKIANIMLESGIVDNIFCLLEDGVRSIYSPKCVLKVKNIINNGGYEVVIQNNYENLINKIIFFYAKKSNNSLCLLVNDSLVNRSLIEESLDLRNLRYQHALDLSKNSKFTSFIIYLFFEIRHFLRKFVDGGIIQIISHFKYSEIHYLDKIVVFFKHEKKFYKEVLNKENSVEISKILKKNISVPGLKKILYFDSSIAIAIESDESIINELEKINKIKKFLQSFFPCHEFYIKLHPRAKVNSLLLHKFKLNFVNEYSKGAAYWIENADIVVSTNSSVLTTAVIHGKEKVISFDFNDSINSDIFKDVKGICYIYKDLMRGMQKNKNYEFFNKKNAHFYNDRRSITKIISELL
jgi:hypothetical protein